MIPKNDTAPSFIETVKIETGISLPSFKIDEFFSTRNGVKVFFSIILVNSIVAGQYSDFLL